MKRSVLAVFALAVFGILFFAFGTVFLDVAEGEARTYVTLFFVLWAAVCISFIVYGLMGLLGRNPPAMTILDVESLSEEGPLAEETDFAAKLEKLEALRRGRLITENEYLQKRSETLGEKW
ncbi:MAG: hypothetical protein ABFD70_00820 [Syntrophaceae bacterium]|nr:hypothetical protein [Deltaproteobacteria bacterium]